jgi:hypothetical protein
MIVGIDLLAWSDLSEVLEAHRTGVTRYTLLARG